MRMTIQEEAIRLWQSVGNETEPFRGAVRDNPSLAGIYTSSIHDADGTVLFIIKREYDKILIAAGESAILARLDGTLMQVNDISYKECRLSVANSAVIREFFPFTRPMPLGDHSLTIGLGDRLGLASPGHIRAVSGSMARPVLAQQSIRELNLTGRRYDSVLADVVWAVFQEDYRGGYGADGDHLKTEDEVRMALEQGYTMITLDCSAHIPAISPGDMEAVARAWEELPESERDRLEAVFLGRKFQIWNGDHWSFSPEQLRINAAIYQKAIRFAIRIYHDLIKPYHRPVDFELSIDETRMPTDPLAHLFVALHLVEAGVSVNSLAPRFCGEFQKGIDYIGDVEAFKQDFRVHARIARHFGYRLSIHSGSDKFSVFPVIGRECSGRVHVKTAGTNWLEAVKVIIAAEPQLYREIHRYALDHLEEARQYYHISADPGRIPDIGSLNQAGLEDLMYQDDARQVIHICYGLILQARDSQGRFVFRDRIYDCLHRNEALYYELLEAHIKKHLSTLGA